MNKHMNNNKKGLGVAIGLLTWGFLILLFMRVEDLSGWILWILNGLDGLLLFGGIMGLCIELSKLYEGSEE